MIRSSKPKRRKLLSRSALGIALAVGTITGGTVMSASPALAQKKQSMSRGFSQVAAPFNKAIEDAKGRDAVVQARNALEAAVQQNNAAALASAEANLANALSNEKQMLEGVFNAAENDADRMAAGQLAVSLGGLAMDPVLQRRGLEAMIASGQARAEELPRYHFFVGQLAYQAKDYAAAQRALQAALDGGYTENDPAAILAEAYIADNKTEQGLQILSQAITRQEAAGSPAPASWYRRGLAAAYNAKNVGLAADFGAKLGSAHPDPTNWGAAITIVRELGSYGSQEVLDLMRLMGRTNSYAEERDYIEYIQAADPRRLPGEVVKIVESGVASGKLNASDAFVAEARTQASGRIAADKASLNTLDRDARNANANEATISGTADAMLSYGEAAKAEELYNLALNKPGADAGRLLTRIGIAQFDQGKYAAAEETFAKVTGTRAPIARLWAAYAASKAPGAAPAPAG